jgi:hypothetical protein
LELQSTSSLFDIAASFVLHTNRHIFLTGRAGTGKTTFLKYIKEHTTKNTVIVAPTGVAAINAGGVTMHSFFQLPIGYFLPVRQRGFTSLSGTGTDLPTLLSNIRFNKEKRKLIEELDLLIIDEVSMLRADLLDAIDGILRHFRKRFDKPFGGVQVLYIGDLYQLPPVVGNDEWTTLSQYYKSMFFFDAQVMSEDRPFTIELDTIYRQTDKEFIDLLNNIRNNKATEEDLALLNKRYDPYFYPEADDGYIILTSHNYKADKINKSALAKLPNETYQFEGTLTGDFNEKALPVDKSLALKEGAQVMFIRNDKGDQRRFYNGKIGIISRIRREEIYVRFPGEREELLLEQESWRNIRYNYNESAEKVEEQELGSYKQYPLRLAWAVTIHKSQGLTFEKAIIDAGESFAPGQVYVALSRLTALKGLVLSSQITPAAIQTEQRIVAYSDLNLNNRELQQELLSSQKEYLGHKLLNIFDWSKMSEAFREHFASYTEVRLPHQAEAVAWASEMLRHVAKLQETGERFSVQLKQLISEGERDNYRTLHDRIRAAQQYYVTEMRDKLLDPWRKHYDDTKPKPKVKKYLRTLENLHLQLLKKKKEIDRSLDLSTGLAEGKNINQILANNSTAHKQDVAEEIAFVINSVKEDSKSISLRLLKEGKSIDEIAQERSLARSTIEGHLVSFIPTGEVALSEIVSPENELAIRNAIKHSSQRQPAIIREALGNTFSYSEIRAVLTTMEKEEQLENKI